MYHTVDTREGHEIVEVYGQSKGAIEQTVSAFALSLGGARPTNWAKNLGVAGFVLGAIAFTLASHFDKSWYGLLAAVGAIVLVVVGIFFSQRMLPGAVISSRDPSKGKLVYEGGAALMAFGIGGCLAAFLLIQQHAPSAEWPDFATFIGGIIAVAGGTFLGRRGKQLLQPTATELRSHDQRPPVVLLRSFGDDDLSVVEDVTEDGPRTADFEESIEDHFAPFGPFIAIGKPGEKLPTLGAARNYYADTEWHDAVATWMKEARMLVVIPGLTGGLGWELDTIRHSGHIGKLLVLMPPRLPDKESSNGIKTGLEWRNSFDGRGWRRVTPNEQSEDEETRWDTLRQAFAGIGAFNELPEDCPDGLIALHSTRQGDLILLTGPEIAWERDYERAIRFAIYGMYCHDRDPSNELPAGNEAPGAPGVQNT